MSGWCYKTATAAVLLIGCGGTRLTLSPDFAGASGTADTGRAGGHGGGPAETTETAAGGTDGGAGAGAAGAAASPDVSTTTDGALDAFEAAVSDGPDTHAMTDGSEDAGADTGTRTDAATDTVTMSDVGTDAEVLHFDGSCTHLATEVCIENYNRLPGESFHLMNLCVGDNGTWDFTNLCQAAGKIGGCRMSVWIDWYYSAASAATGMTDCAQYGGSWLQP